MRTPFRNAAGLMSAIFLCAVLASCGKDKSAEGDKALQDPAIAETARVAPKLTSTGAMLEKGYAALMVAFPEPVEEGDWLTLVRLLGEHDTDKLPRIPLAASHSVTVLNIPPGYYTVDAKAWVRKSQPYAGGISDTLTLVPGELLLLRAAAVVNKEGSFDGLTLREAGRKTWTLTSPQDLTKYIADAATSARG